VNIFYTVKGVQITWFIVWSFHPNMPTMLQSKSVMDEWLIPSSANGDAATTLFRSVQYTGYFDIQSMSQAAPCCPSWGVQSKASSSHHFALGNISNLWRTEFPEKPQSF
jgi:hypothetical protein